MQGYGTSVCPNFLSQVQYSSTQVLQNNNRFDIIFLKVMKHQLLKVFSQVQSSSTEVLQNDNRFDIIFFLGYETLAFPRYLSQLQSSSTQVLQNNNRFDIIFLKVMKPRSASRKYLSQVQSSSILKYYKMIIDLI